MLSWSDRDVRELARMAGLISFSDQVRYLRVPGLRADDIQNFWSKRVGIGYRYLHGMPQNMARDLCTADAPVVHVEGSRARKRSHRHTLILWCDAETHLVRGTPMYLRRAVRTMARFQRWLFNSGDVRRCVLAMRRQRCRRRRRGGSILRG